MHSDENTTWVMCVGCGRKVKVSGMYNPNNQGNRLIYTNHKVPKYQLTHDICKIHDDSHLWNIYLYDEWYNRLDQEIQQFYGKQENAF